MVLINVRYPVLGAVTGENWYNIGLVHTGTWCEAEKCTKKSHCVNVHYRRIMIRFSISRLDIESPLFYCTEFWTPQRENLICKMLCSDSVIRYTPTSSLSSQLSVKHPCVPPCNLEGTRRDGKDPYALCYHEDRVTLIQNTAVHRQVDL